MNIGAPLAKTEPAANPARRARQLRSLIEAASPAIERERVLTQDVREKIEMVPTIERADVELVFDPPWDQSMMSEEARLEAGLF